MIPGECAFFQGIFSLRVKDGDTADLQLPGSKAAAGTGTAPFALPMFTSYEGL